MNDFPQQFFPKIPFCSNLSQHICICFLLFCTGNGIWTHTGHCPQLFKSCMSTNSIIPAHFSNLLLPYFLLHCKSTNNFLIFQIFKELFLLFFLVTSVELESTTRRLKVCYSTNWVTKPYLNIFWFLNHFAKVQIIF